MVCCLYYYVSYWNIHNIPIAYMGGVGILLIGLAPSRSSTHHKPVARFLSVYVGILCVPFEVVARFIWLPSLSLFSFHNIIQYTVFKEHL